jgi:hypothetical protein
LNREIIEEKDVAIRIGRDKLYMYKAEEMETDNHCGGERYG